MKIDTDKLLTPEQAGERIGANKRAVYRAIKRASEADEDVVGVGFSIEDERLLLNHRL